MSNPIRYVVKLTVSGSSAYVRHRPDWDGSWYTRQLRDAKVWKTRSGAQRWVDEHSYERSCLGASVHEVA